MSSLSITALLVAAVALFAAGALALAYGRERRRASAPARGHEEAERAGAEQRVALERAVARLEDELVAAYLEVRRVGDSRSWRYVHALSTLGRTLVGRRTAASESAVDLLVERLEAVELPSDGALLGARSGVDGRRRPTRGGFRGVLGQPSSRPATGAGPAASDELGVELMVAALGLSETDLERALELLTVASGRDPASLLVVVDDDPFDLMREAGCPFEFVPPRTDWERHFPEQSHEDFLEGRLAELVGAYAPARTLVLGELTDPVVRALARPAAAPAARTPAR